MTARDQLRLTELVAAEARAWRALENERKKVEDEHFARTGISIQQLREQWTEQYNQLRQLQRTPDTTKDPTI